jgi:hypothetical protein
MLDSGMRQEARLPGLHQRESLSRPPKEHRGGKSDGHRAIVLRLEPGVE